MIITAAPVGAVPRHVRPSEAKFVPALVLEDLTPEAECRSVRQALLECGWEFVHQGGIGISNGAELSAALPVSESTRIERRLVEEGWFRAGDVYRLNDPAVTCGRAVIPRALLRIGKEPMVRSLVLCLTAQGWTVNEEGDLEWKHGAIESYLPPDLVAAIEAPGVRLLQAWLGAGWTRRGAGYWRTTQAGSPFLPLWPEDIVSHCVDAVREGAAILHLHTREASSVELEFSGLKKSVRIESQRNHIDEDQYDAIVPRLQALVPQAVINLSTSVRGGAGDSLSVHRRSHLKPYAVRQTAPDMSSLSPGAVIFQAGGGYENLPEFLSAQLMHGRKFGVRPEIEVFNGAILENATGSFKDALECSGQPVLFMLVVGVDQHRIDAQGACHDDSLIPVPERKEVLRLLASESPSDEARAHSLCVERLRPVVRRIRTTFEASKISMLMPGSMQSLLVSVALELDLDGIRIGLEDGLNVIDPRVPGGLRRGTTAEQVRQIRVKLEQAGAMAMPADEVRDVLGMVRPDIMVWRRAVDLLSQVEHATADKVLGALATLRAGYRRMEAGFAVSLSGNPWEVPASLAQAQQIADQVTIFIREHGLYARLFIEERDRYPQAGATAFKDVHRLQALNFAREVLLGHGSAADVCEIALQVMARAEALADGAYLVPPGQMKGEALRFLEYLTSIPCRYNEDRTFVVNTNVREETGYSETMARLFAAINELALELRGRSEAQPKQAGLHVHRWKQGGEAEVLSQAQAFDAVKAGAWVVLPSTPTTHYPEGLKLSHGLTGAFASFLGERLSSAGEVPHVIGIAHAGLDEDGRPLIESSMLHNRFSLNTQAHEQTVSFSARLIYETFVLPRLVERPEELQRSASGLLVRDNEGRPLDRQGLQARRLGFQDIESLVAVKYLAHSSGIATIQQIDTAQRQDLERLGYSRLEQDEIFGRGIAISFASACDVCLSVSGTSVVDVTAYNDIRSVGGTTTHDYLDLPAGHLASLAELVRSEVPASYRYKDSSWVLRRGSCRKVLLRRVNVLLRQDPLRLHDGHSIRRYLEGAPQEVVDVLVAVGQAHPTARMDFLLRQYAGSLAAAV